MKSTRHVDYSYIQSIQVFSYSYFCTRTALLKYDHFWQTYLRSETNIYEKRISNEIYVITCNYCKYN